MKSQNKIILLVLAGLAVAIASIYWRDVVYTLPAATIIGVPLIMGFIISLLTTDAIRLRTEQIIWSEGHNSIRNQDIIYLPWQESTFDENNKYPFNEELVICPTGGLAYSKAGLYMQGPIDHPILIFPSIYLMKEGNNFYCPVHMDIVPFRQIPLYAQDHLLGLIEKGDLKSRIDLKETPIYYGNLSKMDGSLTAENAMLERKFKQQNEESTYYENRINRLYSDKGKQKDHDKREIIVATPLKRDEQQDEEQ